MPYDGKSATRRRKVPWSVPVGNCTVTHYLPFGAGTVVDKAKDGGRSIDGIQETVSEGHPWRSRVKGNVQDIGGDFLTTRQHVICDSLPRDANVLLNVGGGEKVQVNYRGPIFPISPVSGQFPPRIDSSNAALDTKGATAIARCKPTKSAADLGTALGELYKDGLPHLLGSKTWRDRTLSAKNAGDEYLNVQFGWKPLLNDVKSFLNGVSRAQKLLNQYERDAGRVVRRKYEFPIERTYTEETGNAITWLSPIHQNYLLKVGVQGNYSKITETSRRIWFSGAFSYFLPKDYSSRSEVDRLSLLANNILGLELDPEVLWNVTPWSWAIDWFSNTGDVLSNVSDAANAGLVMRWGYVMEHTISKVTYKANTDSLVAGTGAKPAVISFVTETKKRRRANPFGFGLNWSGLSPYQLSIAAALGISRR